MLLLSSVVESVIEASTKVNSHIDCKNKHMKLKSKHHIEYYLSVKVKAAVDAFTSLELGYLGLVLG